MLLQVSGENVGGQKTPQPRNEIKVYAVDKKKTSQKSFNSHSNICFKHTDYDIAIKVYIAENQFCSALELVKISEDKQSNVRE